MTLTDDPPALEKIVHLMLGSHQAVVDYMTPLGLYHIMEHRQHYGPGPWLNIGTCHPDERGLGYDRTDSGSKAVDCYAQGVRQRFASLTECPDEFLLWFHHVPWDYHMRSGKTLWDELCLHYQSGVDWVRAARRDWATLSGTIDKERYQVVADKLTIQEHDAIWWRDACLLYFQSFSHRPLPAGVESPQRTMEEYKKETCAAHPVEKLSRLVGMASRVSNAGSAFVSRSLRRLLYSSTDSLAELGRSQSSLPLALMVYSKSGNGFRQTLH